MNQSLKRGYLALTVVLLVVTVVVLVIWVVNHKAPANDPMGQEQFEEMVRQYEDTLVERTHRADSARRSQYRRTYYHRDCNYRKDTAGRYSTPQSNTGYTEYKPTPYEKKQIKIELSTADTLDLQQLRGIGPVYARRICRYRDLLGGFYKKEQLLEVNGLSPELYNEVAPYLTLDTTDIRPLKLNTATIKELNRHPYLDFYQAKAIVVFRQKGGTFEKPQDLLKVNLIDEATYQKIKPYVEAGM